MDSASIVMIILVLVALAAGLVAFGVLRERGRSALTAGCAAIAAGLTIISGFVLFQIISILT
ncbi:MAG TPA: hypothetical protein VEX37_10275 [Thermomicrobiales bacterium]|jgi:hypothetical protein|nr:hypothetical protein [Thermomicrobiales bacterium]